MKLSEIRDNVFGGICAGATSVAAIVGSPVVVALEMADGKSFSEAMDATGKGIEEVTNSAFEWGKENAETAAQVTGLALGVSGAVARHNANTHKNRQLH